MRLNNIQMQCDLDYHVERCDRCKFYPYCKTISGQQQMIEQLKSTTNGCGECMFFLQSGEDIMNNLELMDENKKLKQQLSEKDGQIVAMYESLKDGRNVLERTIPALKSSSTELYRHIIRDSERAINEINDSLKVIGGETE